MATLTFDYTFVPGQLALASEINANFQKIQAWAAGQLGTENISSFTARPEGGPIIQITQTANYPSININNNSASTTLKLTQGQLLNTNERVIWIQDSFVQSASGAAHLYFNLNSLATIPAIEVNYGLTKAFELTSGYLRLETLLKPAIRTQAQRDNIVTPEEGSVLYNTDTDELNVKRADAWMPVGVPVGTIQMYAVDSAPEGWLLCNGQAVSRATYSKLFDIISTTYGVGDNSTTFNLPNLVGIFPRGSQMGGVTTQTIGGETFNAQVHATTQQDATALNGLSDSGHTHAVNTTNNNYRIMTALHGGVGGNNHETTFDETPERPVKSWETTENPPIQAKSASANLTSSDTETRPANISLAYIIKY